MAAPGMNKPVPKGTSPTGKVDTKRLKMSVDEELASLV